VDPADVAQCRQRFADFAVATARRAPLYATLSASIAADDEIAGLLTAAPPTQRQPVLLFACVHALLLAQPDDELASWYPNLRPAPPPASDPGPAFRRFCRRHREELLGLLARRSTQTNEIGRCAVFLPVFGLLADEVGPVVHVDVGTSAGLNLLLPHYGYRYEPGGTVGEGRAVELTCGVRGPLPIPAAIPPVVRSIGLDRAPIDVTDDDAARWLEACVWPDQTDRFERLRAAIALAREVGVDVRRGDAVTDTPALVAEVGRAGHPVVTNSWVLSYFTPAARGDYLAMLDAVGAERDLSWIYVESPAQISGLPVPPDETRSELTVLTVARWRDGRRTVDHVARCHPHGYWMQWG